MSFKNIFHSFSEKIKLDVSSESSAIHRSGGGVVDNTLDYQSRDRKIDPSLLRSFGPDFKPRSPYDLVVGGTLNRVHSLTLLFT